MSLKSNEITKEIIVALIAAGRIFTAEEAATAYAEVFKTVDATKETTTTKAGMVSF